MAPEAIAIVMANYLFLLYYSIKILIPATFLNKDTEQIITKLIAL
jgi:hypothetical protein